MAPALTIAEARARVLGAVSASRAGTREQERVAVEEASGRVLAEDLVARADVPSAANSAMDGFAVRAGAAGRRLRISGESRAGAPSTGTVGEGDAARISTGATIPPGADAVVRVEDTEESGDSVLVNTGVPAGANIRAAGGDLRAGALVLAAGTVLGMAEIAAAVAAGAGALAVAVRPRVAVLGTGDELRPPGEPLGPGQIHNTNGVALRMLAEAAGAVVVHRGTVPDDRDATRDALAAALGAADVLLVSGGVSVGPHDHVRPALADLGVEEDFWRVALQPGRPTWFGTRGPQLVFGLPGNPVSALVTAWLFARPALRGLQGAEPIPPAQTARLGAECRRQPDRAQALRVSLSADAEGVLVATPTGAQNSHLISSLQSADALGFIEPGSEPAPAGLPVAVELLR
jgi:molybdopterin molybdotransferase